MKESKADDKWRMKLRTLARNLLNTRNEKRVACVSILASAIPIAESVLGIKASGSAKGFLKLHYDALSEYCRTAGDAKPSKPAKPKVEYVSNRLGSAEKRVAHVISKCSVDPRDDAFLKSFEWRAARMMAIKRWGAVCQCCGASPATGAVINVDHIKPRKLFPELALDQSNLQCLCHDCNAGKGNWDQTDWRPTTEKFEQEADAAFREMIGETGAAIH